MVVSLNGGTPKHPKMIIFSGKTHGCWVSPFWETPICGQLWTCKYKSTLNSIKTFLTRSGSTSSDAKGRNEIDREKTNKKTCWENESW